MFDDESTRPSSSNSQNIMPGQNRGRVGLNEGSRSRAPSSASERSTSRTRSSADYENLSKKHIWAICIIVLIKYHEEHNMQRKKVFSWLTLGSLAKKHVDAVVVDDSAMKIDLTPINFVIKEMDCDVLKIKKFTSFEYARVAEWVSSR